ncbi:MAG TPA: amino acid adenylation domain-containing protein [Candidatus Binataceae bacterium]|nr:amino acid adenylation domain-containing protein [Candidatus Binataceae bacterium]
MKAQLVPDVLMAAVEQYPARTAIVMGERVVTYAEFDAMATKVARSLVRYGVRPGDRVALWMPKSIEAIAAIWGIMRAGAAYVPLDATAPVARIAGIICDCAASGLITSARNLAMLTPILADENPLRGVWLPEATASELQCAAPLITADELESEDAQSFSVALKPGSLANIQYTSGSTGAPKGVMVPHHALLEQMNWTQNVFHLTPDDRLSGHTPLHSAMASFDIFMSVLAGAALYPVPPALALFPREVAKLWSAEKLSVWFVVPSVLSMMIDQGGFDGNDFSSLRIVGFGGERATYDRIREIANRLPHVRLFTNYSCTEAKIRILRELPRPFEEIDLRRIGPISGAFELFVLDDDDRPVGPGEVGKLWIVGSVLMLGYWGRPEETARALREVEPEPGRKVKGYCTGDLVRRLEDGGLELVGRADQQIKIRGNRVEPSEIEAALTRRPEVQEALVFPQQDAKLGLRVVAVVVAKDDASIDQAILRRHCAELLPAYMVPAAIYVRSAIPRLSNGKVDRRAALIDIEDVQTDAT